MSTVSPTKQQQQLHAYRSIVSYRAWGAVSSTQRARYGSSTTTKARHNIILQLTITSLTFSLGLAHPKNRVAVAGNRRENPVARRTNRQGVRGSVSVFQGGCHHWSLRVRRDRYRLPCRHLQYYVINYSTSTSMTGVITIKKRNKITILLQGTLSTHDRYYYCRSSNQR